MYYNVIKKVDLQSDDIGQELNLLYEVNKDSLVSIACFSQEGELIGAAPAGNIKKNVDITEQSWFADAEERMKICIFQSCMCRIFLRTATDVIIG